MSVTKLLTPLKRQTLSADVYEQFKELLISGRMMPGEQISLRGMAEGLGVSVMPVREAVQRLTAEQALEITPNRSLRVPQMSVSQFREITSIRKNLEGLAAATAAQCLSDEDTQKIVMWHESFVREMKNETPDGARLISLNKELHFAIYRGAKMPVMMQLIEALWLRIGPILNYDMRSGPVRVNQRTALTHHASMVDSILKKDVEGARQALEADIQSAADFIISVGVLVSADAPGG
ncbi:GntR family transcriptional regulator [Limnohabitans sp. 2KL-17]|uniref:GntR family transcriptional regulator n=1 Tax=Limnohabitans sp. 2KL-17 TaxID=1100704 RepID=UPI000D33C85B|nr:GntR family transcriptional regulator [Limnohabitans sp. 2KL-17]PUE62711.1 GntR family transcriptional regulator [Limnohabitans sp. 2KL-17]